MTFRLLLAFCLLVSIAQSQGTKKQSAAKAAAGQNTAAAACDCSIYPIHPESCVRTCGQVSGTVVGMTSDHITLAVQNENKSEKRTFALKPALYDKVNIKPDTQVTVTYNKSNQVVQSVTAK